MTQTYKKKLIEVAMPLEAINKASDYEKKPGIGAHPRGIHHWWARRPHTAARAFLLGQLIDDPSALPDIFPTVEEQTAERKRLLEIIEQFCSWKSNDDPKLLQSAQVEINKSGNGKIPTVVDPFLGGGTIPFEARRLGLPTQGSDLNPVPVILGKMTVAINPIIADLEPLNSTSSQKNHYRGYDGLAEDFRHYGQILVNNCKDILGTNYPSITDGNEEVPSDRIVAWIWATSVVSPDPSLSGQMVPLVKSFDLCTVKGKRIWIQPNVTGNILYFDVKSEEAGDTYKKVEPTIGRQGGRCIISGSAIPLDFIRDEGKKGKLGQMLLAVAVKSGKRKRYLSPSIEQEQAALSIAKPEYADAHIEHWPGSTNCVVYGRENFADLFSNRQYSSLTTISKQIRELENLIRNDIKETLTSSKKNPRR